MDQNQQWLDSLKRQFNQNPAEVIAVGSLAATAIAKLILSLSSARRSRIWDREVARRERRTYGGIDYRRRPNR